jgi:glutaconate CoA-transferase subunit B
MEDVKAKTGWDLRVADDAVTTSPPTTEELEILRGLKARTREAHAK